MSLFSCTCAEKSQLIRNLNDHWVTIRVVKNMIIRIAQDDNSNQGRKEKQKQVQH